MKKLFRDMHRLARVSDVRSEARAIVTPDKPTEQESSVEVSQKAWKKIRDWENPEGRSSGESSTMAQMRALAGIAERAMWTEAEDKKGKKKDRIPDPTMPEKEYMSGQGNKSRSGFVRSANTGTGDEYEEPEPDGEYETDDPKDKKFDPADDGPDADNHPDDDDEDEGEDEDDEDDDDEDEDDEDEEGVEESIRARMLALEAVKPRSPMKKKKCPCEVAPDECMCKKESIRDRMMALEAMASRGNLSLHIPAEAENLLAQAYTRLHTFKAELDQMDELNPALKQLYRKVMGAVDKITKAKDDVYNLRMQTRKLSR